MNCTHITHKNKHCTKVVEGMQSKWNLCEDNRPVSLLSCETNITDDIWLCDKFSHVTDRHFPESTLANISSSKNYYFGRMCGCPRPVDRKPSLLLICTASLIHLATHMTDFLPFYNHGNFAILTNSKWLRLSAATSLTRQELGEEMNKLLLIKSLWQRANRRGKKITGYVRCSYLI